MFFTCQWQNCDRSFSNKKALKEHMRTHEQDRPFKCEICEQSFKQFSSLQKHARVHDKKKPFMCKEPGCLQSFSQDSRPNYNCIFQGCQKQYLYLSSLKKHLNNAHQVEYDSFLKSQKIESVGFTEKKDFAGQDSQSTPAQSHPNTINQDSRGADQLQLHTHMKQVQKVGGVELKAGAQEWNQTQKNTFVQESMVTVGAKRTYHQSYQTPHEHEIGSQNQQNQNQDLSPNRDQNHEINVAESSELGGVRGEDSKILFNESQDIDRLTKLPKIKIPRLESNHHHHYLHRGLIAHKNQQKVLSSIQEQLQNNLVRKNNSSQQLVQINDFNPQMNPIPSPNPNPGPNNQPSLNLLPSIMPQNLLLQQFLVQQQQKQDQAAMKEHLTLKTNTVQPQLFDPMTTTNPARGVSSTPLLHHPIQLQQAQAIVQGQGLPIPQSQPLTNQQMNPNNDTQTHLQQQQPLLRASAIPNQNRLVGVGIGGGCLKKNSGSTSSIFVSSQYSNKTEQQNMMMTLQRAGGNGCVIGAGDANHTQNQQYASLLKMRQQKVYRKQSIFSQRSLRHRGKDSFIVVGSNAAQMQDNYSEEPQHKVGSHMNFSTQFGPPPFPGEDSPPANHHQLRHAQFKLVGELGPLELKDRQGLVKDHQRRRDEMREDHEQLTQKMKHAHNNNNNLQAAAFDHQQQWHFLAADQKQQLKWQQQQNQQDLIPAEPTNYHNKIRQPFDTKRNGNKIQGVGVLGLQQQAEMQSNGEESPSPLTLTSQPQIQISQPKPQPKPSLIAIQNSQQENPLFYTASPNTLPTTHIQGGNNHHSASATGRQAGQVQEQNTVQQHQLNFDQMVGPVPVTAAQNKHSQFVNHNLGRVGAATHQQIYCVSEASSCQMG